MMRSAIFIGILAFLTHVNDSLASTWTTEIEKDPFENTESMTAFAAYTFRSGFFLMCDKGSEKIEVRVPTEMNFYESGFVEYSKSAIKVANDKGFKSELLALVTSNQSGNAMFVGFADNEKSKEIIDAILTAQSKIYVKLGEGDVWDISARGSTRVAQEFEKFCGF